MAGAFAATGCERLAGLGDLTGATPAPELGSAGIGENQARGGERSAGSGGDEPRGGDGFSGDLTLAGNGNGGTPIIAQPVPAPPETCTLGVSVLDECILE